MSIEALNEQLLRAVGVGIALFASDDLSPQFQNEVFETWFETQENDFQLNVVFPSLDIDKMKANILEHGHHAEEIQFRRKRRTIVIAQKITQATVGDKNLYVVECQNISRIRELEAMLESYSGMVERNTKEIKREKEQVEKLLLNIMPRTAYDEYKTFGIVSPKRYADVSALFLDFSNFAEMMDQLNTNTFVSEVNELFTAFDRIGEQYGCERVKTMGDRYVCISGLQDGTDDHQNSIVKAALQFLRFLKRRNEQADFAWNAHIGLGRGAVIGSVVGAQNYIYDIFGEAISSAHEARRQASPMEVVAHPSLKSDYPSNVTTKDVGDAFHALLSS